MRIAALVLAAGQSERMGRPKMLLPWMGRTIVEKVVEAVLAGDFPTVRVIVGYHEDDVRQALATIQDPRLEMISNPDFPLGMLSSVQAGTRSLDGELEGMMIALGDQPQIEARIFRELAEAFQSSRSKVLIPSHRGKRGHPIFLRCELLAPLLELDPVQDSLHTLTSRYVDETCTLPIEDHSIVQDLDTPEDYAALLEREG
jgi:molybdenum cofactor cytidylyltransferase